MTLKETDQRIKALPSPDGPGFFRKNDSKAKKYYFYYVNEAGEIVLVSKIYQTARSRNKAQQQLESGAYELKAIRQDDRFGYTVINKGNKAMSAGPLFPTEKARNKAIRSLPEILLPKKVEQPAPEKEFAEKDKPQRYSFRLNFYQAEDTGDWQGRISYPLLEKKESFQGLDIDQIGGFVQAVLAKSTGRPVAIKNKPPAVKVAKSAPAATKKTRKPPKLPPLPPQQPLLIHTAGQLVKGKFLNLNDHLDIELTLEPPARDKDYRIKVYAKSLNSGEYTELDSRAIHWNRDQKSLQLPITTAQLRKGPYRLNAEILPADAKHSMAITQATSLVQFL